MSNLLEKASIVLTPTAYSDGALHSIKPIQTLGSELVTNGSYDADSDWTKGTGWTIGSGKANFDGGNNQSLAQDGIIANNKKYKLIYTISNYVQGGINWRFGTSSNLTTVRSANGTYVEYITSTGSDFRGVTSGTSEFSIDNVSVKEVTAANFDFTRSTTATRENSSGNIESVAANLPRIDYLGGTAHVLLEPQSTNTATYSNDFTQGDIFNGSSTPSLTSSVLSANQSTAPDGTNTAQKLTDDNDSGTGSITLNYYSTTFTSGEASTVSIFVKKDTVRYFRIGITNLDSTEAASFDLDTGLVSDGTGVMTDYGDGWYRCSVTTTTTTDLVGSVQFSISENSDRSGGNLRNGTKSTFLWGLQAQELSFSTSYIPTSGSTVTRSADVCDNSGSSDLINSTEGVLYAEINALANYNVQRMVSVNGGNHQNVVKVGLDNNSSNFKIKSEIRSGSSSQAFMTYDFGAVTPTMTKVAVKYKENDFALWVNGVERATDTSGNTPIGLNKLSFTRGDNTHFLEGKVKCVAVFKEALTDAQLTALTS